MKKILLFTSAIFLGANGISQVADFETVLSQTDTAYFGQDQTLSNTSTLPTGGFKFENTYNIATWGSYSSGWSFSNITDNTTVGFTNQYSNITGAGDASIQYATCNVADKDRIFEATNQPFAPIDVSITNTTYAYLSMLNGDTFATQFGDITNASAGQDSLVLSIYGLDINMQRADSVNFYLADFTNGNSLIVSTWTNVDLTSLGTVYGLDFSLTSSDNGMFGMNTPAYFALDNLTATGITTADIEGNVLASETSDHGQNQTLTLSSNFTSGFYSFENTYNDGLYGAYSQGWSYSSYTDVTTPGSTNQYSAITGTGENSDQYAICNAAPYINNRVFSTSQTSFTSEGAYFTNTTFAALSMENGDAFATQFGDITNSAGGEDYFLLTIYGLNADSTHTGDSVNFYLADYRFADDADDYIIKDWTWVDLTSLENVYGYDFVLTSSDFNSGGILTPAYFAMDNLGGQYFLAVEEESFDFNIYPNPAQNTVTISTPEKANIQIIDLGGRIVYSQNEIQGQTSVSIEDLNSGIYLVQITSDGNTSSKKLVKQ